MLESNFKFSKEYLRNIRDLIKSTEKRVIIGYNQNEFGEAIVTTGIPIQTQPDKISYAKVRKLPYEHYMFDEMQRIAKRR